jgi:hypothetical protein
VTVLNDEQTDGWSAIVRVIDEQDATRSAGRTVGPRLSLRVALGSVIYQADRHGIPLTQAMALAVKRFGESTVRKALMLFPDDASIAALLALDCLASHATLESPDLD